MINKCNVCNLIFYTPLPENKIHAIIYDGKKCFERVCKCDELPFKEVGL